MAFFHKNKGQHEASAKVVGDTLIISLPGALSPVVWRMDLSKISAAALEVTEGKEDTPYILTMKNENDKRQNIAPFDDKGRAIEALMAITKAMEDAPVHAPENAPQPDAVAAAPASHYIHAAPAKKGGGKVAAVIGIVLLCALIFMMMSATPRSIEMNATGNSGAAKANSTMGEPLSADDFLMNR